MSGSTKRNSLLDKMAQLEAEKEEQRRLEAEKDRPPLDRLREALDATPEVSYSHKLAETKKSFAMHSALNKKIEKKRKEERQRQVERETASDSFKERLASTYHSLELNSTASNLDAWCHECGCIHTSDVVGDEEAEHD